MKNISLSKFEFLDGIRGLCALFVALYHAQLFTGHTGDYLNSTLKPLNIFLSYGHFSVAVFIVLSGFCLTIPVVKSNDKWLKGGFKRYISRRFTRIIPPYYFALLLSVGFILLFPILQSLNNTAWDTKLPLNSETLITHILLIHNVSENWIFKINGPLWSVATEWQIYFVFPILLALWNRFGLIVSFGFAIFLGLAGVFVLPAVHSWYLGLFAMGMVASIICFSTESLFETLRTRLNWSMLSWFSFLVLVVFLAFIQFSSVSSVVSESVVGLLTCVILISFTLVELRGTRKPLMLQLFNSRIPVFLGTFSYSLYLIHSPILGFINLNLLQYNLDIDIRLMIMLLVSVPFSAAISYIFYLVVEKRFIPKRAGAKDISLELPLSPKL